MRGLGHWVIVSLIVISSADYLYSTLCAATEAPCIPVPKAQRDPVMHAQLLDFATKLQKGHRQPSRSSGNGGEGAQEQGEVRAPKVL